MTSRAESFETSGPAVVRTTLGGAKLELIETAAAPRRRFRVEIDGERRSIRVRKVYLDLDTPRSGSHDWIEGDDADVELLVECLEAGRTKRSENAGLLVLEMQTNGLSGLDVTTTVTVGLDRTGIVVVDMKERVNEVNPHVGW